MGRSDLTDILVIGGVAALGLYLYKNTNFFDEVKDMLGQFGSELKGAASDIKGEIGGGAGGGMSMPGGGGVDKNGVKLIYPSSGITYSFSLNPNDGMRYDFKGLPMNRYLSCELTGYFTGKGSDEISGKLGGGAHNDSNKKDGTVYDLGVGMADGATRIRFEGPHNNYSGTLATGSKGCPLGSSPVGYKFIKIINPPTSVRLEIWQDCTNNNAWKKIFSYTDTKYKHFKPITTHQETLRLDKIKPGHSKLSLSEIKTGATSAYTQSLFTYNRPLPVDYYNRRMIAV